MKKTITFGELEGGKKFLILDSSKGLIKNEYKNCVFLKFVPQVRSLPYNCMCLHDQKMFEVKEDTIVSEVLE